MKRKKRDFSRRERELIDGVIDDICRALHLPTGKGEFNQCGWAAFLDIYRDTPVSFFRDGDRGWRKAYQIIWDALYREKQAIEFWYYGISSLDQSVSDEIDASRIELLQSPCGDFQNGVCLYDYIQRMEGDTQCMAYDMIHGSTLEEIRAYYHWSNDHAYRVFNRLRTGMEEYLKI